MKKLILLFGLSMIALLVKAQQYELYDLRNAQGMTMSVTNFGARIVKLCVPDKYGKMEDVVCGFDTLEHYSAYKQNFGATVGRYIGRILNAKFTLDGKTYHLDAEKNGHCSHGGKPGFANRFWTITRKTTDELQLKYISPDGESGFPGELTMLVTMRLTDKNELRIDYEATTTRATVLNPSNHSFFNISADFQHDVLDQSLMIDADSIAVYDDQKCLTGEMMAVEGTPFDFRTSQLVGKHIDDDDVQLKVTGGYDHTYQLRNPGDINRVAASIYDPKSGRTMDVLTTEPALHIYTANGLKANMPGKNNTKYARRTSICFETMHYADSPNKPKWPSTVLRKGEVFHSTTIYRFR